MTGVQTCALPICALRLLEIATEAKEGGAKVILRSADGTQEEEVLTVVDD